MNLDQKKEIFHLLDTYMKDNAAKGVNQTKAFSQLKDVSEATLIAIKDMKWNGIKDETWRTLGIQLGWRKKKNSFIATLNASTMITYFDIAKEHGEMFAIVGPTGSGKSEGADFYRTAMRGKNVWYIQCAELWNKSQFLQEMLKAMGKKHEGMNVYDMMESIVYELSRQDSPLFIVDEVDKLRHEVLIFFITLYNKLHRTCGIVWLSTDTIVSILEKGIRRGKKGYKELYSRIGKSYIYLEPLDDDEIKDICLANGITDANSIRVVQNECDGDIRRLDRNYLKAVMQANIGNIKERIKQLTKSATI